MDHVARDIRTALRALRRAPGFTRVVVAILGIGIGMAAAMATVFESALRRRLPVTDQERLLVLWTYSDPAVELSPSRSVIDAFAKESRTLSRVGGFVHWGTSSFPMGVDDRTVVLNRSEVTGNFFEVLGAHAVIGRLLHAEDGLKGADPVVVLSYGEWRRPFGSDPKIVESLIKLDGQGEWPK
jgi:hypothetical protein